MRRYPVKFKAGITTREEYIPLAMMMEHEKQCVINHGKRPEILAANGGTSYLETYFILVDQRYDIYMEEDDELEIRAKNLVQSMAYRWLMNKGALKQIDL